MNQSANPALKGIIYNLQRYNLHDGAGIRTIIFLKGCPLRCPWCSNPESQRPEIHDMGDETVGYEIGAAEAVARAARDKPFFKRSGGGITISGGEPLMQPEFALALAREAKALDVHIAMESSAYASPAVFEQVVANYDQLLLDLKLMDPAAHQEIMGVPNGPILENIRLAARLCQARQEKSLIVRIPVIPGLNDSWENLAASAAFCAEAGIGEMNLLPYHKLGMPKYEKLGLEYGLKDVQQPERPELRVLAGRLSDEYGLTVKVL